MVWIRIFRTRKEAEWAKKIVESGGFYAWITEDKLFGIPIQRFGVLGRFRLEIDRSDFEKVAKFLAKKLKNK